jgi:hypothetical protein
MRKEQPAQRNTSLNDRKERAAGRQKQRSRQAIRDFQEDVEKGSEAGGASRERKRGKGSA